MKSFNYVKTSLSTYACSKVHIQNQILLNDMRDAAVCKHQCLSSWPVLIPSVFCSIQQAAIKKESKEKNYEQ